MRGGHDADEDDGSHQEGAAGRRGAAQDPTRTPIQLQSWNRQADGTAAADGGREAHHPAVPKRPLAHVASPGSAGPLAGLESVGGIEVPLFPARDGALEARRLPPGRQAGARRFRGSPAPRLPGIQPQGRHGRNVALPRGRGPWHGQGGRLPAGCRLRSGTQESLGIRLESGDRQSRSAPGQRQARPAAAGGGVAAVRLHHTQTHLHQPQAQLADVRFRHRQGGFPGTSVRSSSGRLAVACLRLPQARLSSAGLRRPPARFPRNYRHQRQAGLPALRLPSPQAGLPALRLCPPQAGLPALRLHPPQAGLPGLRAHRPQARLAGLRLHPPQAGLPALRLHPPQARLAALRLHPPQAGLAGLRLCPPQAGLAALRLHPPQAGLPALGAQHQQARSSDARLRRSQARLRPSEGLPADFGPPFDPGAGSLAPPQRRTSRAPTGDFCAAHV